MFFGYVGRPWPQNFLKILVQTHFSVCPRYDTLPQLFHSNSNSDSSAFTYVPRKVLLKYWVVKTGKVNLGCCRFFKDDFLVSQPQNTLVTFNNGLKPLTYALLQQTFVECFVWITLTLEMGTQKEMRYDSFFSKWHYVNQWFPTIRSVAKGQGHPCYELSDGSGSWVTSIWYPGPCLSAWVISLPGRQIYLGENVPKVGREELGKLK